MQSALDGKCRQLLIELGIVGPDEEIEATPLPGGVSSDIAAVEAGGAKYCVKFALPQLKVEADWFAPVRRNAAEYAWLEASAGVAPESAIALCGQSEKLHGFAMEFLEGEGVYLWKANLLSEAPDRGEAARVGDLLGRIHAASSEPEFDDAPFRNRDDFKALRIDPYLFRSASRNASVSREIGRIADGLHESDRVLVHGDVSPKNILFRESGPVILDAECATMGDASFDPSFCLNHLFLKAIHLPSSRERYLANALDFWRAYAASIRWEPVASVESRVCRLLPALMLARIDGKSPVEYLAEPERRTTRRIALRFLDSPVERLDDLVGGVGDCLKKETPR